MDAGTWLGSIPSWKTREGLGGEGPAGRPNKHRGDPNLGNDLKQIHSAATIARQMVPEIILQKIEEMPLTSNSHQLCCVRRQPLLCMTSASLNSGALLVLVQYCISLEGNHDTILLCMVLAAGALCQLSVGSPGAHLPVAGVRHLLLYETRYPCPNSEIHSLFWPF